MLGITQLESHYTNEQAPRIRIRAVYLKTKLPEKPQYKKKHDIEDYQKLIQVNQLRVEHTPYPPKKPYTATAIKRNSSISHIPLKPLTIPHQTVDKIPARYVPRSDSYVDIAKLKKKQQKKYHGNKVVVRHEAISPSTDELIENQKRFSPIKASLPVLNIQTLCHSEEDSISEDEDTSPFPSPVEPPERSNKPIYKTQLPWNLVQENA